MKRTYISPICHIIAIRPQGIMALSTLNVSSSNYDDGNMTDLVKSDRRSVFSVWDDDWGQQ